MINNNKYLSAIQENKGQMTLTSSNQYILHLVKKFPISYKNHNNLSPASQAKNPFKVKT